MQLLNRVACSALVHEYAAVVAAIFGLLGSTAARAQGGQPYDTTDPRTPDFGVQIPLAVYAGLRIERRLHYPHAPKISSAVHAARRVRLGTDTRL
jgi:hypothetical protein